MFTRATLMHIGCPLCLLLYTLLLGAASINFPLYDDPSLALSLTDGWLLCALAPVVLYFLRSFAKFACVLSRIGTRITPPGIHWETYRPAYSYLSPFLIRTVLDRWRSHPRVSAL